MQRKRRIALISALGFAALWLPACGGDSPAPVAPAFALAEAEVQPRAPTDALEYAQIQIAPPESPPTEPEVQPAALVVPVLDSDPPDLAGTSGWINSDPTSIEELTARGEIVLLDFWTYSCYNCVNVFPSLKSWHEKYRDLGLTILGVHTPEFDFEKNYANLKSAVTQYELDYPIVQDNLYMTWRGFDNHHWPSIFLIDSDGRLRYRHIGEGAYSETEQVVRALLIEAGADLTGVEPVYPLESAS